MTEQELRALVREAITKVGAAGAVAAAGRFEDRPLQLMPSTAHSSHALFTIDGDPEGRCVIEPGVACTHCGYCKSYGH